MIGYENANTTSQRNLIGEVLDDLETNNKSCTGAPQQTANGLYRCVELAAIIGMLE